MFLFPSRRLAPIPLPYSTEVHCHILPGIDDGAPDPASSIALIGELQKMGINRIIATSHITEGTFPNRRQSISDAFSRLSSEAASAGVTLPPISLAAEHRIDDDFLRLSPADIMPLSATTTESGDNSGELPYLLVENSYAVERADLDSILFDLRLRGFRPVLAHPERYLYYHAHRDRYEALHAGGTLFQVNLLSLAGHNGKEVKKTSEWLLQSGFVDFLGSDIHHMRHASAIHDYLTSSASRRHFKLVEGRLLNDTI